MKFICQHLHTELPSHWNVQDKTLDLPTATPESNEVWSGQSIYVRWTRQKNELKQDKTKMTIQVIGDNLDMVSLIVDSVEFCISREGWLLSDVKVSFHQSAYEPPNRKHLFLDIAPMYLSRDLLEESKPIYQLVTKLIQEALANDPTVLDG